MCARRAIGSIREHSYIVGVKRAIGKSMNVQHHKGCYLTKGHNSVRPFGLWTNHVPLQPLDLTDKCWPSHAGLLFMHYICISLSTNNFDSLKIFLSKYIEQIV